MNRLSSAEDILSAGQPRRLAVDIAEWNCSVLVRELSGEELIQFAKAEDEAANFKLVACAVIREDGSRVFADEDVPKLAKLGVVGVAKIVEAVKGLSGVGKDHEKNSESSPGSTSATDLHTTLG